MVFGFSLLYPNVKLVIGCNIFLWIEVRSHKGGVIKTDVLASTKIVFVAFDAMLEQTCQTTFFHCFLDSSFWRFCSKGKIVTLLLWWNFVSLMLMWVKKVLSSNFSTSAAERPWHPVLRWVQESEVQTSCPHSKLVEKSDFAHMANFFGRTNCLEFKN